jgi:hypothetical protein
MEIKDARRGIPPLWPYLILCGVAALWVDFSDFHQQNTSDSLVPVLTSLYRWTPYYWECNRLGMLVPLLALPFKSPFVNLMVQGWLALFAAFATFFLLARYLLRGPSWPLVGALATGAFVVLTAPGTLLVSTFGQPHYCVAMALGLGALLLAEKAAAGGALRWCLLPALGLILVAHWVNSGTCLIFGPLVVLRALLENRGPLPAAGPSLRAWLWARLRRAMDLETALALGLLAAGLAGHLEYRHLYTPLDDPVAQGILSPLLWPEAWKGLAVNTWVATVEPHWQGYTLLAAAGFVALLIPEVRRRAAGPLRAGLALVAAAVVYGLFMGTLEWVFHNFYCYKYWIPLIFFSMVALAGVVLAPVEAVSGPRSRRVLWVLAAPALLVAVAGVHGRPSRSRARASLDRMPHPVSLVQRSADLIGSRASHLIAPYGELWVSIFHANLCLYEHCEHRVVWGVGGRSWPTWDLWGCMAPEDMRVAGVTDGLDGLPNKEVKDYLGICFPPAALAEKRPSLWLFRPIDEMPREASPSRSAPILASWHGGFYGLEISKEDPAENNRWCGATSGKLTLTNTSDRPRTVTLQMLPHTSHQLWSNFWVESPLFCDHRLINYESGPYSRTVTLPPGKHVLRISCDTPPTKDRWGMRTLTFHIRNFKVTESDSAPLMPAAE